MDIKTRRKELGLSQGKLAALVGCEGSTVSQWETRGSLPRGALLPKVASALECTVADLLPGGGDSAYEVKPKSAEPSLDSRIWQLLGKCVDALEQQFEYNKDMQGIGGVIEGLEEVIVMRNALLSQK